MNFTLHKAICAANTSVGAMMSIDFAQKHDMHDMVKSNVIYSRKLLMDALDALSTYQAEIEAKVKVAA